MSLTTGSLFSGYAGLDMAVNAYFGSRTAWFVEIDAAPSRILAHHWPDVPNHGDITTIDWAQVEPVDILTGGYPCQPFSAAGRRKGEDDERHLWPYVREAIRHLRPRYTLLENVAGHRSLGFDRVLGDLAEDGLHAQWVSIRASDVGACHRRERLFILVTPADAVSIESERRRGPGAVGGAPRADQGAGEERQRDGDTARGGGEATADAERGRRDGRSSHEVGLTVGRAAVTGGGESGGRGDSAYGRSEDGRHLDRWGVPLCQTCSDNLDAHIFTGSCPDPNVCGNVNDPFPPDDSVPHLLPTPRATDGTKGGPNQRGSSGDLMLPSAVTHLLPTPRRSDGDGGPNPLSRAERMDDVETRIIRSCGTEWGDYEPAIRRAEAACGRPAPSPTEPNRNGNPRLSSRFAEWMMMLPDGHVAGIGLSRNEELRALGNGVVPAQAYAALCQLVPIAEAVA